MGMRPEPNVPDELSLRGLARYGSLFVLVVALVELGAHAVMRARVPSRSSWDDAGAFVRARVRPRDAIVASPEWADPLVRLAAGDLIGFDVAGASDLAGFDRLWALSIRGHLPEEAPDEVPALERRFGEVTVRRWDLGPSPVRYDFVDHVREAEVAVGEGERARSCELGMAPPRGGALGAGAFTPRERFVCDARSPTAWVGETITEDLDLRPRRCIHQHPPGSTPLRATFRDVPAGERLVLYAGLYYEDERTLEGAPFTLVVRRDGHEIARLEHRDGEGWERLEVALAPRQSPSDFTFEASTERARRRSVCWAATVRGPRREIAE